MEGSQVESGESWRVVEREHSLTHSLTLRRCRDKNKYSSLKRKISSNLRHFLSKTHAALGKRDIPDSRTNSQCGFMI